MTDPTSYRLGIDIGGTFTDVVVLGDDRSCRVAKLLNAPSGGGMGYLASGIGEILGAAGIDPGQVRVTVHATTLATNAVIERGGAPTAMLTTEGFRDILETGSELVYDVYDVGIEYPEPLVPRERRLPVPERVGADGNVLVPLDEAVARDLARQIGALGVTSVAVCFLHAHRNPDHERAVRRIVQEECPSVTVSLSSDILPETGEYGRFSTTVIDAYVKPLVSDYLGDLAGTLSAAGYGGGLRIMRSSGSTQDWTTVRQEPATIVESGPAAGVTAVTGLHARGALPGRRILSFDMGGTTAKICFVVDGEALIGREVEVARMQRFKRGSGLLLRLPCIDLLEIGAGGGSIADVNGIGLLTVGPESAGADPGPACYGRGGRRATVTDADLVLGYLSTARFAGSRLSLDRALAEKAVTVDVGVPLDLGVTDAALAVHRVVVENMALAARVAAAERGYDLREFELVAFGGAGPMHAAALARALGMDKVVVPPAAGVMSSLGCLMAAVGTDTIVPSGQLLAELDPEVERDRLGEAATAAAATLAPAGVVPDDLSPHLVAVMRYRGQRFNTVLVPLGAAVTEAVLAGGDQRQAIGAAFEEVYLRLYGRLVGGGRPEVVQWHLRMSADTWSDRGLAEIVGEAADAEVGTQPMWFEGVGGCDGWVRDRDGLPVGEEVAGPGLVADSHTATVVPPGTTVSRDAAGFLWLRSADGTAGATAAGPDGTAGATAAGPDGTVGATAAGPDGTEAQA